jgi:DNA-3-methyladenine glycosylase
MSLTDRSPDVHLLNGWRDVLSGPAVEAAPRLLGAVLISNLSGATLTIRITEVEAYGGVGEDPASHAYRGQTLRNAPMFAAPGSAYVYLSHGIHQCLNIVCLPEGQAGAVLLRAAEVVDGIEAARHRAGVGREVADRDLARGPGRLARALGLTRETAVSANAVSLLHASSPVRLGSPPLEPPALFATSPRTGVSQGVQTPWRFFIPGEPTVSPYRAAAARRGHLRA